MPQRPPVLPQAQDVQPNSAKRSAANPWCWPMGLWWLVIILEVSPMGTEFQAVQLGEAVIGLGVVAG